MTVAKPVENIETWNRYYNSLKDAYLFPNEFVVRTFLGSYPNLKMEKNYRNAKIGDIGCGDGRNMTALAKMGFDLYGTEVSDEVCVITRDKLLAQAESIKADIRAGVNDDIPFDDNFFDYMLSWNACYYMRNAEANFEDHVAEFARVMKPGGYLVACVPAPTCFSLEGAEDLGNGKLRLNNSNAKWNMLNGSIYHVFQSQSEIETMFGTHFEEFSHCRLSDDCFGLALDYFVFVCKKK